MMHASWLARGLMIAAFRLGQFGLAIVLLNLPLGAGVPNVADPAERIRFLRAEIARHDELYYRQARPEISDTDYDALKNELTALNEQFPEEAARLGPPPAAPIGDDRTADFPPAVHRERMLSLEKVYAENALREFCVRVNRALGGQAGSFVVEPKFDGLGVSATYARGQLVRVATRGDGSTGDDVTINARRIAALPAQLVAVPGATLPELIEIRGEIFMSFAEFDRLNRDRDEEGKEAYASPRNLAVATLKVPDPELLAWRKLDVVFYGVGACEPAAAAAESQIGWLQRFKAWGLPTIEQPLKAGTPEEVWRAVQEIGRARAGYPFPTDGAVVKLDATAGQRELGVTDRAPRWAVAYKFSPEQAATRVQAITIQVGRTGVLTPVAELAPVRLGGAMISRATLHNAAEIARRDIRVGDQVYVERTGEVIPAVVGVDLAARDAASVPYVFPAKCPACDHPAVRREGEIAWHCFNPSCPAQLRRRLLHFASAEGVGIKGLREGTIDKLVDRGLVHDLPDLYRLSREDLLKLGKNNLKSADTLLAAIAVTKQVEFARFINALGIPGVGASGARVLAEHFRTLDAFTAASAVDLSDVESIGPETTQAVITYLSGDGTRKMMADFKSLGVAPQALEARAGILSGKTFVLTGTFSTLSREQAVERLMAAGAKVGETVTRKTSYLVAGRSPGAKAERARELGVRVLDEAALQRVLAGQPID